MPLANKRFVIYLLMILLGIASGMSDISLLKDFGLLISDIFIKIFRCISMPIVALSLIVTLSSYSSEKSMRKIWQRTLFYTLSTTIIAATVSCLLYLIIKPTNANFSAVINAAPLPEKPHYLQHLASLIPSNVFAPFLEHQVMGVLIIGLLVGIAIRYIPEEQPRKAVIHFFQGIHSLFLVITKWIVAILPLGLYGFITATVVQLRGGIDISGIGEYLAVLVLANLIQGFIILPIWLKFNKIRPFVTMRKMMPALSIAFFSKSSAGTLPITMATAEKQLNISPKISRFILPLCTNINMNGCAAFIFVTVIYLMQNQGIDITIGTMALWILVATIAAVGNAGVPMGCFFLSASLLASMDIPISLLGIILPFYSIIDMIETALNVWSDSCIAKVVSDKSEMDLQADDLTEHAMPIKAVEY
ncbi:MAG: dicarboxylate/amino acid:cation symporter [Gammaproteobacteria bacterium]|nr:dicarboxylate/amino acid:cation symporter [Gammaproteobacteria bacterium]